MNGQLISVDGILINSLHTLRPLCKYESIFRLLCESFKNNLTHFPIYSFREDLCNTNAFSRAVYDTLNANQ